MAKTQDDPRLTRTLAVDAPAAEALDFAYENHDLALSNFDNIWPWRFLKWRRVHKAVNRRLAENKAWNASKVAQRAAR